MKLPDINVNWFDLVVLAMLVAGLIRGRMRGMSAELLPLLQWLLIVFVGAYTYEPLGRFLRTACQLKLIYCNIAVYVFEAVLLKWVFTALKHVMGDKLLTANAFGKGEYIFGIFAGAARFGCIVVMCLAVLHSFYVPRAPETAAAKSPKKADPLGFFSPEARQQDVFSRSLLGPLIRSHMGTLLLKPEPALAATKPKTENLIEKRGQLLNEVINPK